MSKNIYLWFPVLFILGGLVGRLGPTEELRAYRKSAEEKASATASRSANGIDSFIRLANIPDVAKRPRRTPKAADAARATNETAVVRPRRFNPEDLRVRIDEAAELWRTRIELKRATTIERLGLGEKGVEDFDAALGTMNEKLRETMQAAADELSVSGAELTPELGVRLMGDLATSVAEAYDSLGAVVGEDKRGEISRLQLYEFVDPSVADPLVAVQERLK